MLSAPMAASRSHVPCLVVMVPWVRSNATGDLSLEVFAELEQVARRIVSGDSSTCDQWSGYGAGRLAHHFSLGR